MNRSESIAKLATALAHAQAEMPVAVFDATNPFLKSKYASLGAVIQASRPILAKYKLSLVQFPIGGPPQPSPGAGAPPSPAPAGEGQRGGGTEGTNGRVPPHPTLSPVGGEGMARPTEFVGVESILMHESGEFVAERIVIAVTEEKGKTRVQCAGSALTYLRRYSWAAILGMYSDEDGDGSSGVQALAGKGKPPVPPPPAMREMQNN